MLHRSSRPLTHPRPGSLRTDRCIVRLNTIKLPITAWNLHDHFVVFATDRSTVEATSMSSRFVALDEGPDIALDRAVIVVGRDPNCDARLDSLRVSRHHCCMARENDEVVVRDLGSTNGIRINGSGSRPAV